jgi:hypothetical protein
LKAFWFFLVFFPAYATAAEPVFWSATETALKNPISAPAGLVQFVLDGEDADDRQLILECMQEKNVKKGKEAALFSVAEVNLANDAQKAYFVRPALKPYCSAFYGAHLFRYWIVTATVKGKHATYRTRFKNGGDGVGVLPTSTHGLRDLLIYDHTARSQFWTTLVFDGHEYKQANCERKDSQDDGSSRSVACDAQ